MKVLRTIAALSTAAFAAMAMPVSLPSEESGVSETAAEPTGSANRLTVTDPSTTLEKDPTMKLEVSDFDATVLPDVEVLPQSLAVYTQQWNDNYKKYRTSVVAQSVEDFDDRPVYDKEAIAEGDEVMDMDFEGMYYDEDDEMMPLQKRALAVPPVLHYLEKVKNMATENSQPSGRPIDERVAEQYYSVRDTAFDIKDAAADRLSAYATSGAAAGGVSNKCMAASLALVAALSLL